MNKIIFTILATGIIASHAQTWPSPGCPDHPYIKGNSDTIYHSISCAVITIYVWDTAISANRTITKTNPKPKKKPKKAAKVDAPYRWGNLNDTATWTLVVTSSKRREKKTEGIFCYICGEYVSEEHIKTKMMEGMLLEKLDKKGRHTISPLGVQQLLLDGRRRQLAEALANR